MKQVTTQEDVPAGMGDVASETLIAEIVDESGRRELIGGLRHLGKRTCDVAEDDAETVAPQSTDVQGFVHPAESADGDGGKRFR